MSKTSLFFYDWLFLYSELKRCRKCKTDACLPWVNFTSLSSVAWKVVIIFIWLSTFDIRIPLISVLVLIASIRKNNAIVNNIDKKGKSQKLLTKVSLRWDDNFWKHSIFMHAKQLWLDYVQSSNFTPDSVSTWNRFIYHLGIKTVKPCLYGHWGSYMSKVSVLSRLKSRAIFSKRQSKLSVMMSFPY